MQRQKGKSKRNLRLSLVILSHFFDTQQITSEKTTTTFVITTLFRLRPNLYAYQTNIQQKTTIFKSFYYDYDYYYHYYYVFVATTIYGDIIINLLFVYTKNSELFAVSETANGNDMVRGKQTHMQSKVVVPFLFSLFCLCNQVTQVKSNDRKETHSAVMTEAGMQLPKVRMFNIFCVFSCKKYMSVQDSRHFIHTHTRICCFILCAAYRTSSNRRKMIHLTSQALQQTKKKCNLCFSFFCYFNLMVVGVA